MINVDSATSTTGNCIKSPPAESKCTFVVSRTAGTGAEATARTYLPIRKQNGPLAGT